jgi:hypothetical protein
MNQSCLGDLNRDCAVGIADFLSLLNAWGANAGHAADLSRDGTVSQVDLLSLLNAWGPCD